MVLPLRKANDLMQTSSYYPQFEKRLIGSFLRKYSSMHHLYSCFRLFNILHLNFLYNSEVKHEIIQIFQMF